MLNFLILHPRVYLKVQHLYLTILLLVLMVHGTGTIVIDFVDPKNRTISNLYWFDARKPGIYPERIGFETLFKLNCDPTEGKNLLVTFEA